jgi:hypothetical protein
VYEFLSAFWDVIVFSLGLYLILGMVLFFSRKISTKIRNVIYFLCFYVGSVFIVLISSPLDETFAFLKMPFLFLLVGQLLAMGLEKIKRPISFFKKWLLILFLFFGWIANHHEFWGLFDAPGVLRTPVEMPFHLENPNEKIDFMVKIRRPGCYNLVLKFYLKNPNYEKWTAEKNEDADGLFKLLGDSWKGKNGNYLDLGVPLKIYAQIFRVDEKEIIFDEMVDKVPRDSGLFNGNIWKTIDKKYLENATYKIVVENKKMVENFKDRKVNFLFSSCPGK